MEYITKPVKNKMLNIRINEDTYEKIKVLKYNNIKISDSIIKYIDMIYKDITANV